MSSRMEQIIDEIEDYIDNCKYQTLSSTKIVVNKDELEDLLAELRRKTPDEIKRYQKIISNKEAILADAQTKAESIINEAQVHNSELVSEHQIMQQAYAQANEVVLIATNQAQEILDNATNDANNIRLSAIQYTDDMLGNLEEIIANSIETTKARSENLLSSLQESYQIVNTNRMELMPEREEGSLQQSVNSEEDETSEIQLNTDMLE
ncbi:MAG: ATPase [Lachnospiraceae bacterium]